MRTYTHRCLDPDALYTRIHTRQLLVICTPFSGQENEHFTPLYHTIPRTPRAKLPAQLAHVYEAAHCTACHEDYPHYTRRARPTPRRMAKKALEPRGRNAPVKKELGRGQRLALVADGRKPQADGPKEVCHGVARAPVHHLRVGLRVGFQERLDGVHVLRDEVIDQTRRRRCRSRRWATASEAVGACGCAEFMPVLAVAPCIVAMAAETATTSRCRDFPRRRSLACNSSIARRR